MSDPHAVEFPAEYVWRSGRFEPLDRAGATPSDLLVADSWRSEDGRVAAFALHAARFEGSVARVAPEVSTAVDWPALWSRLAGLIDRFPGASLFPRISLERLESAAEPQLVLAVRKCPPQRETTTLALVDLADLADPRRSPTIKGPDIPRLAEAKAAGIALVAAGSEAKPTIDDVILRDEDGACLETTTGALVHWRGDRLVVSNRDGRQLPSVTLRQVLDRATELGIEVDYRAVFPNELTEGPVWFLNTVHGVSPVTEIVTVTGSLTVPEHPETASWRAWWASTLVRID